MYRPRVLLVSTPGPSRNSLHAVLPALVGRPRLTDADDAAKAILITGAVRPDLVIIDTEMGYSQCMRLVLKLIRLHHGVEVIVLSDAPQWRRWRSNRAPCRVLLKGFSAQELKAAIQSVLPAPTRR